MQKIIIDVVDLLSNLKEDIFSETAGILKSKECDIK